MNTFVRTFSLGVFTLLWPGQAMLGQSLPHARGVTLGDICLGPVAQAPAVGGGAFSPAGIFFAARHPEHGTEVWRWTGYGSASLFTDTRPGPESSNPEQFTPMGDMVVWVADDGVRGPEIRGSAPLSPSSPLVDLQPGLSHPAPRILGAGAGTVWFSTPSVESGRAATTLWAMSSFGNPVKVGVFARDSIQQTSTVPGHPHFYFIARPLATPLKCDLYRADGIFGAQLIENLDPGATGATPPPGSYAATPGFVCYRHFSGGYLLRLRSFASGTITLTPESDGATLPWFASNGTDRVCFVGRTPASGAELWSTLGTPGTTSLLAEMAPGSASRNPSRLLMSPGNPGVFFQVDEGAGRDLYFFDPTETTPTARKLRSAVQNSTQFAIVDNNEIALDVPDNQVAGLWLADGATGNGQWLGPAFSAITRMWNPSTQMPPARQLKVVGATSGEGAELYALRNTSTFTAMSLNPGPASASPRNFFAVGNDGDQLCVADTPAGARNFFVPATSSPAEVPLATPPQVSSNGGSSHPAEFTDCGSVLLFTAGDGAVRRLCSTKDGQMNSAEIVPGIYEPEQLVRFQDRVFMLGRASGHHAGLKQIYQAEISNGTATVTPYAGGAHSATALVAAAGRLFFVEPDGGGQEMLHSILPDFSIDVPLTCYQDAAGVGITQLTAAVGRLYFSGLTASANAGGRRVLWVTDGTAAGTRTAAVALEQPQLLGALGGGCVFWRERPETQGYETYVWDGGPGSPQQQDGGPVAEAPERHRLAGRPAGVEMAGRFYFTNRPGALLSTNGMGVQTKFPPTYGVVRAESLAVLNDKLVFLAINADNVSALFAFSEAHGADLLTFIPMDTLPGALLRMGENLWFTADARLHGGTDLWRTDGTEAGTVRAVPYLMDREVASVAMGSFRNHLVLGAIGVFHQGIEPLILNHTPTVPAPPALTGARRGQIFSFTYDDIMTGAVTDFDGDALTPLRLMVWEGTLTRNGAAVESSTEISPGDAFTWLPASATGVVYPMQVHTSDPWQEGHATVGIRVDTPLDAWAAGHFTEEERADPAISGPEADADGDGVGNALEFVFGRHPRTANPEPPCTPSTGAAQVGGRVVRFTFVRTAVLAEGTVLSVESSPDLMPDSWQSVAAKTENAAWTGAATVVETALPDGRVQVVVEMPEPPGGHAFMRLAVAL